MFDFLEWITGVQKPDPHGVELRALRERVEALARAQEAMAEELRWLRGIVETTTTERRGSDAHPKG